MIQIQKGLKGGVHSTKPLIGGHVEIVNRLIIKYEVDPMAQDNVCSTPLHMAAGSGRKEVVRELVTKHGCRVDCFNNNGRFTASLLRVLVDT